MRLETWTDPMAYERVAAGAMRQLEARAGTPIIFRRRELGGPHLYFMQLPLLAGFVHGFAPSESRLGSGCFGEPSWRGVLSVIHRNAELSRVVR